MLWYNIFYLNITHFSLSIHESGVEIKQINAVPVTSYAGYGNHGSHRKLMLVRAYFATFSSLVKR